MDFRSVLLDLVHYFIFIAGWKQNSQLNVLNFYLYYNLQALLFCSRLLLFRNQTPRNRSKMIFKNTTVLNQDKNY